MRTKMRSARPVNSMPRAHTHTCNSVCNAPVQWSTVKPNNVHTKKKTTNPKAYNSYKHSPARHTGLNAAASATFPNAKPNLVKPNRTTFASPATLSANLYTGMVKCEDCLTTLEQRISVANADRLYCLTRKLKNTLADIKETNDRISRIQNLLILQGDREPVTKSELERNLHAIRLENEILDKLNAEFKKAIDERQLSGFYDTEEPIACSKGTFVRVVL